MIYLAGEPDDMWWDGEVKEMYLGADLVWKSGPTIETHTINIPSMDGSNTFHAFLPITVPPGEEWHVTIEGSFNTAGAIYPGLHPVLVIGAKESDTLGRREHIVFSGTVTPGSGRVGAKTRLSGQAVSFEGTVTITKP